MHIFEGRGKGATWSLLLEALHNQGVVIVESDGFKERIKMSLTKEEIVEFTEEYLDVKHEHQGTDDFVIQAWINFFESHRLNPLNEHRILFKTQSSLEPWEEIKYNVRWIPEVVLGRNSFEYEKVYLGIGLYKEDDLDITYPRGFIPEIYSHGLIK